MTSLVRKFKHVPSHAWLVCHYQNLFCYLLFESGHEAPTPCLLVNSEPTRSLAPTSVLSLYQCYLACSLCLNFVTSSHYLFQSITGNLQLSSLILLTLISLISSLRFAVLQDYAGRLQAQQWREGPWTCGMHGHRRFWCSTASRCRSSSSYLLGSAAVRPLPCWSFSSGCRTCWLTPPRYKPLATSPLAVQPASTSW